MKGKNFGRNKVFTLCVYFEFKGEKNFGELLDYIRQFIYFKPPYPLYIEKILKIQIPTLPGIQGLIIL